MASSLETALAEPNQMPAACPICGGVGCNRCSHTGQAEFCGTLTEAEIEEVFGPGALKASDLRGLARTGEEIAEQLELAAVYNGGTPNDYRAGVAAAIRWLTGEVDEPPLPREFRRFNLD